MLNILVIDDESPRLASWIQILLEAGCNVEIVRDARSATELLRQHVFDVIVSRLAAPHISALRTLSSPALWVEAPTAKAA